MISQYHHSDEKLWCKIGRYFASREIRAELGGAMSSDDNYHWFIATDKQGEVTGFAAVELKKSGAWFRHSYVFEASRHNGVYGELLKARMSFVKQQGPDACPMITCTATEDSLQSLLKIGFVFVGKRGKYTTLMLKM